MQQICGESGYIYFNGKKYGNGVGGVISGIDAGEWSATYVFGIGGLSKKALETNAVSEMYKNAGLTGNQQIINITTTQSVETWALVYSKVRAIAHGYVIEFEE